MIGWILIHVLALSNPTQPLPGTYFATKEDCQKVAAFLRGGSATCVQAIVPGAKG